MAIKIFFSIVAVVGICFIIKVIRPLWLAARDFKRNYEDERM